MKRAGALLLVTLAAVACKKESGPPAVKTKNVQTTTVATPTDMKNKSVDAVVAPVPTFLESCGMGEKPAADGTVSGQQTEFASGTPVYLTMRFKESPAALQSRVVVYDKAKKVVNEQFRAMNGAKVVTFTVPANALKAGETYRLEGYWGGNVACESDVKVKK